MKNFLLLLGSLFLVPFQSDATIRTVSNNPNSPGQYTDITVAMNAAAPGDTLYIHGSTTSYGNINIKKSLTLIGTGNNPNKQFPLVATIGYISLDTVNGVSGCSGVRLIGLTSSSVSSSYNPVRNVEVKRCYITGYLDVTGSGWLVENNILTSSVTINNKTNVIIRNNVFTYVMYTSNQPSVVITNNIFFGNNDAFSNISNATISNNIFYGRSAQGCSSCQFNNNISFATSNNTFAYGTNISTGNFENQNPSFVNVPAGNYTFNYANDYHLAPNSVGKSAGTDGTDIGIYGGSFPFVPGLEPRIPQVKSMNINNTVVPLNGTLNINVKAAKQD